MKYNVEVSIKLSGYVKVDATNPHEAVALAEKRVREIPNRFLELFHKDEVRAIRATEDAGD